MLCASSRRAAWSIAISFVFPPSQILRTANLVHRNQATTCNWQGCSQKVVLKPLQTIDRYLRSCALQITNGPKAGKALKSGWSLIAQQRFIQLLHVFEALSAPLN